MQPAGLPGRTTGRGAATTPYPSTRRGNSLSPQHLDYRHAGTRAKDAFGAADAAGLRPVLDPARPPARTWAPARRKGESRGQSAMPCKQLRRRETAGPKPYLTTARSFRDEKRKVGALD
jgi:hypothetical protein